MDGNRSTTRHDEDAPPTTLMGQMFDALTSWLFVTVAIAVAPALAVWPLAHHDELEALVGNALDSDLRFALLGAMAISALIVGAFYAGAHALLRRGAPWSTFPQTCRQLNRYAFVVVILPVLVHLLQPGIESSDRIFTLALIAITSGFVAVFAYRILEPRPGQKPKVRPTEPQSIHWALVAGAFVFYASYISYLAVLDHRNIGTHTYDLGIYTNLFHRTANGDFLGCSYCKLDNHISSHFDPIIWVFSWVYKLKPDAETLLLIQANWLGTLVFPLFMIANRTLKNPRLAVALCWIATLYPPLHGANMFDFHSLTMVIPTVVWLIYFVDSGSKVGIWVALGIMLITREDMPLLACFIGAYAILRRRHAVGFAIVGISLSYLVFIKTTIMPDSGLLMDSKETTSFAHFFSEMIPHREEGIKGFVVTALTNPTYALDVLFKEARVFFGLVLFLPLLFLPLLGGRKRFMMLYGLAFLGLASRKYVYDLHFQYSSVLFPILLAATPDGLVNFTRSRIHDAFGIDRRRVPRVVMITMAFAMGLTSIKYGVMVPNRHFRAGWNTLNRKLKTKRYEFLQELLQEIPDDAAVCASSSLGPHISDREKAFKWPACKDAEYALLRQGSFKKKKSKRRVERMIRQGRLVEIDADHDIVLYEYYAKTPPKDGKPKDKDEESDRQLEEEANRRPDIEVEGEGEGDDEEDEAEDEREPEPEPEPEPEDEDESARGRGRGPE